MPRLVLFFVLAWLALPGTASAFTKTEYQLPMSDGVKNACPRVMTSYARKNSATRPPPPPPMKIAS